MSTINNESDEQVSELAKEIELICRHNQISYPYFMEHFGFIHRFILAREKKLREALRDALMESLAQVVSPAKLRLLADWHDMNDEKTNRIGNEVQTDLRKLANQIEALSTHNTTEDGKDE